MYDLYSHLLIERRGSALWVTIGNSDAASMTPGIHGELSRVFRDISSDPDVRVVVLTGSGNRTFCAGADIQKVLTGLDNHAHWINAMREAREIVLNILECDKPVICRINGHAIGLGSSIALCCDITVMVETSKIGDTHVKVGLVAGDGGSLLWPHLIGMMNSKRYLLTGDLMTGREAANLGLITEAVAAADLDAAVEAWVRRFANGATRAIAYTKRSLNMAVRRDAQIFMDAQLGLETLTHLTEDHREGISSFLDKREPRFKGR